MRKKYRDVFIIFNNHYLYVTLNAYKHKSRLLLFKYYYIISLEIDNLKDEIK